MNITMAVRRIDDKCHFYADKYTTTPDGDSFVAGPITFNKVKSLFEEDGPENTMLVLPLEEAKKMAKEILEL